MARVRTYRRPDPRPGMPVRAPNGVTLGWLEGTVLSRWLHGKQRMLRVPVAWTIDKQAFDQLRADHDVTKIIIHDQDAQLGGISMYAIEIEDWDAHVGEINRGRYDQYFVTLGNWRKS